MQRTLILTVLALAWLLLGAAAQPAPATSANLAFPDLLSRHLQAMQPMVQAFSENSVQVDYLEGDEETGEHIVFNWQAGKYRKEFYWVGLTEAFGFDGHQQWHGSDYNLPRRLDNGEAVDITSQLIGYFAYLTPEYSQYLSPVEDDPPLDVTDRWVVMRFAPPEMSEALVLIDPLNFRLAGMLLGNDHLLDKSILFVLTTYEDWADYGDAWYPAVIRITRLSPENESLRERLVTTLGVRFVEPLADYLFTMESSPPVAQPELPEVPFEVPFSFLNDKVVLRCRAPGGQRLRLELDTGANVGLLRHDVAEDLELPLKNHGQITGHGGAAEVQFVRVEGLVLESDSHGSTVELPAWPAAVLVEDDSMDNMLADNGVNGLLGNFLLHNFVVKIDYRRRVLSLYPPDQFDPAIHLGPDYHSVPVTRARMPYVEVTIDDKIKGGAFFNTGAHHFFTLHAWAIDDAEMFYEIDALAEGITIHGKTLFGVINPGTVQLGDIEIANPPTHMEVLAPGEPPNRNEIASFGNAFFERYTVTFDLFHEMYYIEGV